MHNTLRGVFPEPKPVPKKNFIKENVKHIKRMQGILQNSGVFEPRTKDEKFQNVQPMVTHYQTPVSKSKQQIIRPIPQVRSLPISKSLLKNVRSRHQPKERLEKLEARPFHDSLNKLQPSCELYDPTEKYSNRGVQTESAETAAHVYDTGIIKYPSPSVLQQIAQKRIPKKKSQDHGDTSIASPSAAVPEDLSNQMQNLGLEKPNFIKENMLAVKQKNAKQDANYDPTKAPPSYRKGVLPKYLRDRKDEQIKEGDIDPECPEGHVLLPEEERRETLRVLRQSYADRIQELNCMPVRNDTLRMRKRKMEIEEELKKIDEGIKVFQRPKVFVKVNV